MRKRTEVDKSRPRKRELMAAVIGTITVPVAVKVNGEWQEVGEVQIPLTIASQKTNPHTNCREITITTEPIRGWEANAAKSVRREGAR